MCNAPLSASHKLVGQVRAPMSRFYCKITTRAAGSALLQQTGVRLPQIFSSKQINYLTATLALACLRNTFQRNLRQVKSACICRCPEAGSGIQQKVNINYLSNLAKPLAITQGRSNEPIQPRHPGAESPTLAGSTTSAAPLQRPVPATCGMARHAWAPEVNINGFTQAQPNAMQNWRKLCSKDTHMS